MSEMLINHISTNRLLLSLLGIMYVWSLPVLSLIGFAEKNSTSISEFIANPPATGAMAAISFLPLNIMWEYQDFIIDNYREGLGKLSLYYSLSLFQLFYASFLVCTIGYVPSILHTFMVTMFALSFLYHAFMINKYIQPNTITWYILLVGLMSFASLLVVKGMWFWAMECIGFSSMLLFTPIDYYIFKLNNSHEYMISNT